MIPLDLTADREGERLDAFLARSVPDLTRSAAQRLLERGAVTLRGRAAKKNDKTRLGDSLTVCLPEPQPVDLVPQNIPLDVIYAVSYTHLDVYKRQGPYSHFDRRYFLRRRVGQWTEYDHRGPGIRRQRNQPDSLDPNHRSGPGRGFGFP